MTGIQREEGRIHCEYDFHAVLRSGFDEGLSEYAEENGIILIDGQILIGDGKLPDIF